MYLVKAEANQIEKITTVGETNVCQNNFQFNFSSVSGERRFHLFQKPFCNRCKALILIPD